MRVAPAGHISACGVARDRLLARDQAGAQLDLDIADAFLLRLGETLDVVVREANVVF